MEKSTSGKSGAVLGETVGVTLGVAVGCKLGCRLGFAEGLTLGFAVQEQKTKLTIKIMARKILFICIFVRREIARRMFYGSRGKRFMGCVARFVGERFMGRAF